MTIFLSQKRTKGYENEIIIIIIIMPSGTLLNSNKFYSLKKSLLRNVDTFKKHLQIEANVINDTQGVSNVPQVGIWSSENLH